MASDFNIKRFFHVVSILLGLGLFLFIAWYFSSVTIYVIVSIIVTLLCSPIKQLFARIRYKKFKIGNTLASALSLSLVVIVLLLLFHIVLFPVSKQINAIVSIDTDNIETTYNKALNYIDGKLKYYHIIEAEENLEDIIVHTAFSYIGQMNISSAFGDIVHAIGAVFLGIFSVLFISFFFLKDFVNLQQSIINIAPANHRTEVFHILERSKRLLSNYFVGLSIEMILMGLLEFIILSLLGIENALLISFLGGIMVVVPYIGSLIACIAGCFIAGISGYIVSPDANISIILVKVLATFVCCRIVDNFFLQPFIASKSVKAHPLEIFIVVLLFGSLAGIPGMMLGIPAYTVIRIIAQEFFGYTNFVKTLTSRMKQNTDETQNNNNNSFKP
ncbi:MAG: AI-2E family transporter [Bacteroidales bacterium]|jgi:predicted PurR-regulated permease PerM|nr:AI-2E family transporter [Bacteroidales bacterium]